MPVPDGAVLGRRSEIVEALRRIVPGEGVIDAEEERRVYESDALTAYRTLPMVVVLPETVEQVRQVMRYCGEHGIKVVPRGAGTSLSGGALPLADGVLLGMGKFRRILEIDIANRCAVVQPGVTNLAITHAVQDQGFYYAPDPSSQIACTIGGNVGENSGGVHCLKYGLTTNNVIGIEMVTIEGEVVRLGGKHLDAAGYDLLGVMVGLRGPARRGHRGHRPAAAEAAWRAGAAGRLPERGRRRRLRRRHHRRRDHPGRHGDDGPARGAGGGSVRACWLSAGGGGAADRRARWLRGRARPPDRFCRGDRPAARRQTAAGSARTRRSG